MNSQKNITSATVVNGGRNYSSVFCEVTSFKTSTTNHPSIRAVTSPKGGHGSNILKELNVKDVLIIVEISEEDSEKIIGGGSYRQFGIIKNPVLNDGTGSVAGKTNPYYRDITITPYNGDTSLNFFDGSQFNTVIGSESYAIGKVVQKKSESSNTVTLKILNTSGQFITKQSRPSDYTITTSTDTTENYLLGETVSQTIPAGTVLSSGVSYGFPLTCSGVVLDVRGKTLDVRLSSNGNFVVGSSPLVGNRSGMSKTIVSVDPRYGEFVYVTNRSPEGIGQFVSDGAGTQKLYKVIEVGPAYIEENALVRNSVRRSNKWATQVKIR